MLALNVHKVCACKWKHHKTINILNITLKMCTYDNYCMFHTQCQNQSKIAKYDICKSEKLQSENMLYIIRQRRQFYDLSL